MFMFKERKMNKKKEQEQLELIVEMPFVIIHYISGF